jgi:tetratricopeptide (TPR) repeat protein
LTTIDPMAALLRDEGDYPHAEELLTWALHLREATFGPKGSELISTIDSLAYVQFGQQKYLEAEVLYKRLLALWEQVGGPEHPMLALTLDKMAEFYIEQKFYDLAEPLAQRALAIRAKMTMESLHRSGRVLVGREKFTDATEWYARTVRIAAETRMPDEELPGVLRTYALLLRQMHRGKEADVISKRIKEAIDRKTEKEGRRPLPPSVPLPKS